jgi:hypothetical protein
MIIGKGSWYLNRLIWSVCNHASNHLDNMSGIRTRAIKIVNVFEMEFGW